MVPVSDQQLLTTYSFVLPHPSEARFLLLKDERGWSLPQLRHPDGWFAEEGGALARVLGEQLGLQVTALRHLLDAKGEQIGELENHSPAWRPPAHGRWAGRTDLAELPLSTPEHRPILERWLDEAESGCIPGGRAPWERRGWYAEATAWIREQATRLGHTPDGPILQHKAAWDGSSILRVPTKAGDLWLKAVYHRPPAEPAVIALLAERWPANVPHLLAVDLDRRWMLMRDMNGVPLEGLPPERWDGAVRHFSLMQIDSIDQVDRWLALGCPDRRAPALAAEARTLLEDEAALLGIEHGLS